MLACAGWELQNILTAFPFRELSPKSLNLAVDDVPYSTMDLFQRPAGLVEPEHTRNGYCDVDHRIRRSLAFSLAHGFNIGL